MHQDLKHFHDFWAARGSPGSMLLDPALLLTQEHQNLPIREAVIKAVAASIPEIFASSLTRSSLPFGYSGR